jgi:NADH:ubiquinone reductase (H+-translocating)
VEFTASLRDAIFHSLLPVYPTVDPHEVRVILVEALPEILSGLPRELANRALRVMEERGVQVRTGTAVAEIEAGRIHTKGGEIMEAGTIVWGAGVRGTPRVADLEGGMGRDGRVPTNELLQLPGHPEVYVIGDCARFTPPGERDGKPLPPNAPVAIQEGEYVGDRIAVQMLDPEGRSVRDAPFRYRYKGELVALGRNEALAHIGPVEVAGFPGFVLWRLYYFSQLMGFKNRASIFVDWIATYFQRREVTRLPVEKAAAVVEGGELRAASALG